MLSVTIICLLYGYFFLFVVTVEEICPQRVHAYCFAATVILVYCFFCIFVSIYFSRKHFSSYLAYFRILYCFFCIFVFIYFSGNHFSCYSVYFRILYYSPARDYFLLLLLFGFSALTLLLGWQEGHPACKN